MKRRLFLKGLAISVSLGVISKLTPQTNRGNYPSLLHQVNTSSSIPLIKQVVISSDSTGLGEGHRIVLLSAVEILDGVLTGRYFHKYIDPERQIDSGPTEVHGITNEFVQGKPKFSEIIDEFKKFIHGSNEIIIHNAPFDMGFINNELELAGRRHPPLDEEYLIVDNHLLGKKTFPLKPKHNLDAICKYLNIDIAKYDNNVDDKRAVSGALQIADAYLAMKALPHSNIS